MDESLGYAASAADWNEAFAGRPYNIGDWNTLTIGEQRRYADQDCKTKGAIYKSHITANKIEFSVDLPPSLAMTNLARHEAVIIERWLHRSLEKEIATILQARGIWGGEFPNDL